MAQVNHDQFLNIAREISKSSNCVSMSVGALIVVENRIISHGYNGTPPGYLNCKQVHLERGVEHTKWSMDHEIHAELNAILWAARNGLKIEGGVVYGTCEPCKNCLKHMIGAGLKGMVFEDSYYNESREDKEIKYEFAKTCGFKIGHKNADGIVVEWELPPQQSV